LIDIGANVGLISLFVASRTGSQARILAIEPEPGNFARLSFNLAANQGTPIQPFQLALADGSGELAIELNRRNTGGTRTQKPSETNSDLPRVRCCSLLEFLQERALDRIDALKIDVEDFEHVIMLPFFRDAPRSLWPRLIMIERGMWPVDVIGGLEELGYAISSSTRHNVILRR
jgi:FkbM family methyltransferase